MPPDHRADSVTTRAPRPAWRVWVDEPAAFTTLQHGRTHHNLQGHPLFQLPELEWLALELEPLQQCRFIRPGVTQSSAFRHADRHPHGLDISAVFRRIEEPGSWIALYNVEAIPRYRALLSLILDSVRPVVERDQGRIVMETGFIFVSAPPSVTPFHIDRENNFWLQLHGRKTINVWPHGDRITVAAEAVENFIVAQSLKDVRFHRELQARSAEYEVGPGDGVYFPSTSPHMTRSTTDWVTPGDAVSVSIGVNFYTDATLRTARVHQVNRLLRTRFGVVPNEPRLSPRVDAFKAPVGHLVGAAREWRRALRASLRRGTLAAVAPPGSY